MTLKSRIPQIIARSETVSSLAVSQAIANIEFRCKARSRRDTGTMKGGWQGEMTGYYEGIVYNLVYYTIYNEYGTYKMSAQPMLGPAIAETFQEFRNTLKVAWLPL